MGWLTGLAVALGGLLLWAQDGTRVPYVDDRFVGLLALFAGLLGVLLSLLAPVADRRPPDDDDLRDAVLGLGASSGARHSR